MKLPQLEHPVQKKYTIPYLPETFYIVSFLVICILLVLNVALVGSDVVTTLVSNPYVNDRPWWMPSFWPDYIRPRSVNDCQPVSLVDTQALHTNSSVSLFTYAFRRANVAIEDGDPTKQMRPVPYMANSFEQCEVRTIMWALDLPSRNMKFESNIFCKLGGQKQFTFIVPENLTLQMTHHVSANYDLGRDSTSDYVSYNTFSAQRGIGLNLVATVPIFQGLPADSASANNVLAVLDGFRSDLIAAVLTEVKLRQMNNIFFHSTYIVEWAAGLGKFCFDPSDWTLNGPRYNGECLGVRDPYRTLRAYGTSEDRGPGFDLYPEFLAPFAVTSTNFLIALRDAIRIDLGDIDASSNIYLNKTYFDEVIEVDPYREAMAPLLINADLPWRVSYDHYWVDCTPWTCSNGTWTETFKAMSTDTPRENLILPYRPTPTASVFNLSYLCPKLQRKPIASLLMSVFVSTVTMYNFLYALFGFVMPKVEALYQRRRAYIRDKAAIDSESQRETSTLFEKLEDDLCNPPYLGPRGDLPRPKSWHPGFAFTFRGMIRQNEARTTSKSAMRYSV
ncbi:unnamed protein product [Rhizoctonia solani]|uniref:Transmembrane protein n=1 Tax=Rhizoctonia solani TaxID=456999 RepID=A0A8H3AI17_9AGAM|nr:unnamed protein product [Rhizoctonia solani]